MEVNVLMIDDHKLIIEGYKSILSFNPHGYEIKTKQALCCESAYELITTTTDRFDLVTIDYTMPAYPEKEETKEAKVEAPYKSTKSVKKVEATEAARTKWNPHGDKGGSNRAGLKSKKMFKAGSGTINEEVAKLRKQNDEYKKALVLFKDKLNEVAVFNASLAYSTRLFTEHSTTKQEKQIS